jgi:hypothetical protein
MEKIMRMFEEIAMFCSQKNVDGTDNGLSRMICLSSCPQAFENCFKEIKALEYCRLFGRREYCKDSLSYMRTDECIKKFGFSERLNDEQE